MADNRNIRYSGQPPGNFGMMPNPRMAQFQQPGIQMMPMMQSGMMMPPGSHMMPPQQMMFPVQQMGMRPPDGPGVPPPAYTQKMADNFRQRAPSHQVSGPLHRPSTMSAEQLRQLEEKQRKEKQFLAQKQKLQAFGRPIHVDTDKFSKGLMESMFGKVEKPKPKKDLTPKKEDVAEQEDDGFGDFMAGPCTNVTAPVTDTATEDKQSLSQAVPEPQSGGNQTKGQNKEEKKDLMSMMMECSDLKAPNKAKTFHRPALKELPVTTQTHHHTFHQSQQARQWTQPVEELSELFTVEPATQPVPQPAATPESQQGLQSLVQDTAKFEIPGWCKEEDRIPPVYKQVLEAAIVNGQISTERLYPILLMSGLSKQTLGQIWFLANRTTPGQLIKEELYLMLALVAFAQNNFQALTMDMLNNLPQPPIPFLGQSQAPSGPTGPQSHGPLGPQGHGHPGQQGQGIQGDPGQQEQHVLIPPTAVPQHVAPTSVQAGTPLQSATQLPVTQSAFGVSTGTMEVFASGGDDDFADFQAAKPTPQPETSVPAVPKQPARPKKKPEIEYLYEVPTPAEAEKMAGPITSEMTYSNVQNFFGSDDSSVSASPQRQLLTGPSTPNSLEADFDDFKSADSKPSDSSQFSSEQSENEDFKVFESYLEDFERRKQKQQESPLHRPVSKSSLPLPSMPSTAVPTAIPAIRNLWTKPHGEATVTSVPSKPLQNSQFHTPDLVVADSTDKSDPHFGNSPTKSSDSDFADFQQAPVVGNFSKSAISRITADHDQLKASGSDVSLTLIGEEDKYAALRTLDFGSELSTGNETVVAEGLNPPVDNAEDNENWADFQGVVLDEAPQPDPVVTNATDSGKESILSLFNSAPPIMSTVCPSEISNQPTDNTSTSVKPLPLESNTDSDWSSFGDNSKVCTDVGTGLSGFTAGITGSGSGHLEPALAFEQKDTESDDWADFQGPDQEVSSDNMDTTQSDDKVISVKKEGLRSEEILGLFKVREPQELPTDLKVVYTQNTKVNSEWNPQVAENANTYLDGESTLEAKKVFSTKAKRLPSLGPDDDEDSFRVPPPMDDDHGDEDFGEFSRGYEDMDDYHQPQNILDDGRRKYPIPGMGIVSKPVVKESKKSTTAQARYADIMALDQTDVDQGLSKDPLEMSQDRLSITKSEDSQSVSSLELPFSKSRLQNVLDQDTQSISSNEYGNFETISPRKPETPVNVESKSVDSLDLIKDEGNGDSSEDQGSGDQSREQSPEKVTELTTTDSTGIESSVSMSDTYRASMPLPVLGDRYSNILQDIPGSDKHSYEWQRCLDNSYRMIKDANNIFNSISSSVVCNEVLKSEQGSEYVQGVVEIFRVVCRITTAMKAQGLATDKLTQLLKDIDLSWNNLTAFLVGGNLMPDDNSLRFNNAILKSDDSLSQRKACGVCLLNVDVPSKNFSREEDCPKLTYGGRQYHAACANFWVNCVDSTLPALKLPELL
ncbi:synergin gamma-like isoform X2 [Pecten maximus]|uniref:synergin gamma-like isoform X2 n=1 Tax=Pecten maximus TaxID=6579 RepID=UPI001458E373|nr:synergin gamma-like isoform X2 [Pecten maximus]